MINEEKPFNGLTPGEAERLAILAEEMGEAIQLIGKVLRHGYDSKNPLIEDSRTNRQELEKELGDVEVAIYLLDYHNDIDSGKVDDRILSKCKKIGKWLHHTEIVAPKE